MIRISGILACYVLAAGCVSTGVYPDSWAELQKVNSGACPDIDGVYRNAGELGLSAKEKAKCSECGHSARSLARFLNVGHDYRWHEGEVRVAPSIDDPATYLYESILLQLVEDTLHVEASLANGVTETFDLPTRRQCSNSTLLLRVSWGTTDFMESAPFVTFLDHSSLALGKAEDGSLLVRSGSTEGLFLLHIPLILGHDGDWAKFSPVAVTP